MSEPNRSSEPNPAKKFHAAGICDCCDAPPEDEPTDEQEAAFRERFGYAINDPRHEDNWRGVYPGMCIDPEVCRGKTHCPRDYSCCE